MAFFEVALGGGYEFDPVFRDDLTTTPLAVLSVRRQSFWVQMRPKLRESLAHLVGLIMRRVVCDASVAL
ncbi:hypothetical protein, partial [Parasedimentitalea maritima]|uniref:hypothetical protein n=1 Tax=Parasedimentitalea maritima TaxID=2578117 RepID=UPI001ADBCDEB